MTFKKPREFLEKKKIWEYVGQFVRWGIMRVIKALTLLIAVLV